MTEPSPDAVTFYLILTAANEIYDDWGEGVSLDKIKQAILTHAMQVNVCNKNENDIISDYQQTHKKDIAAPTSAMLVQIKNASPNTVFNPHAFFVKSYTQFELASNKRNTVKNPEESSKESEQAKSIWGKIFNR